jgi:hypothetical protein
MRFTASRVAATVGLQQNPRKSELVGNRTALWAGIHPSTFFSFCCFAISFQVHWLFPLRRLRASLQKWTPTALHDLWPFVASRPLYSHTAVQLRWHLGAWFESAESVALIHFVEVDLQ